MLSLFDMLSQAQDGRGMELLARQFNLSQQQAQLAVEALLPAFSQGLKRNASDPYGLGSFMAALASGNHAKYFEDAAKAFSPQGVDEGNGILGHLFGSKELSRAVAAQAAQATGIGQQVLQQMLPVIASMVMGGLFKQSTGQMPHGMQSAQAGGFGANNPLGQIIEEMMKQGGGMMGGQQPQQRQAPQGQNPFDPLGNNPFGKVLQDMFGGAQQQQAPQRGPEPTQNPSGDNPWGKILEDMLGGGQAGGTASPRQASRPEPQANPSGRQRSPYDDIFGKMFETGRQQRDEYEKNMGSVFDQFLRGMDRNR
jgi:hypothetical protein